MSKLARALAVGILLTAMSLGGTAYAQDDEVQPQPAGITQSDPSQPQPPGESVPQDPGTPEDPAGSPDPGTPEDPTPPEDPGTSAGPSSTPGPTSRAKSPPPWPARRARPGSTRSGP